MCLLAMAGETNAQRSTIGLGWAQNSINGVIFRRNSVVSYQGLQYASHYDSTGQMVLAKRKLESDEWMSKKTPYKGNVTDAHRSISMMVDGDGYLHLSWNHHSNVLHYCKSIAPGSLELTEEMSMIGREEDRVTYPEFYKMPDGDLLFFYRDGSSGQGNLVLNRYSLSSGKWTRLHDVLVDGEGERNAYWQTFVDVQGTIHLSWVWRESGDVATNHDMAYAKSMDGGLTWCKTTGEKYLMPISEASAEYAVRIPQKSELINSTSMYADSDGNPYIATYYREKGSDVPQFYIIYNRNDIWSVQQISDRTMPFTLSGGGTKKIPISRPQIAVDNTKKKLKVYVIYRDAEYGSKVRIATNLNSKLTKWDYTDVTDFSVESWEPSYDTELWKEYQLLHIFVQKMGQGDGEKLDGLPAQPVYIYEVQL
ncbi:MAG: BNR repeat-containing protein [Bacteroidetes bacterium]|nr:BNR repeat-containing protein [Bacteroidota bacterium]